MGSPSGNKLLREVETVSNLGVVFVNLELLGLAPSPGRKRNMSRTQKVSSCCSSCSPARRGLVRAHDQRGCVYFCGPIEVKAKDISRNHLETD